MTRPEDWVAGEMGSVDPVQLLGLLNAMLDHSLDCFSCVALIPERLANPIPEFTQTVWPSSRWSPITPRNEPSAVVCDGKVDQISGVNLLRGRT